jgi:hypothetical protein
MSEPCFVTSRKGNVSAIHTVKYSILTDPVLNTQYSCLFKFESFYVIITYLAFTVYKKYFKFEF